MASDPASSPTVEEALRSAAARFALLADVLELQALGIERADQPVGPKGSRALAETCRQAVGDLQRLLSASYPNIGPPRIWNRRMSGSSRVRPALHPNADPRPPDTSGGRTTKHLVRPVLWPLLFIGQPTVQHRREQLRPEVLQNLAFRLGACAAAHARDETRWPRPDVRQPRGESAGAGVGCASCGLNGVREAGRANGLCRVAQRILDRGVGDPRGRWPSACPMSQAGVLSCLRENTASAVLFTEVLANHALAALVCGAPTGSAAPSPAGLSGAGQDGPSTREGRHTHAARTTAVNRGEGVTELTWCSSQSVRAARVRRPAPGQASAVPARPRSRGGSCRSKGDTSPSPRERRAYSRRHTGDSGRARKVRLMGRPLMRPLESRN